MQVEARWRPRRTLLADEPDPEMRELPLIAEGQERGISDRSSEIAASLEEVEVTKEQIAELHAHLRPGRRRDRHERDRPARDPAEARRRPATDPPLTRAKPGDRPRRSSPAWTRCGSTCARSARVQLLTADQEVDAGPAHRARRHASPSSR